MDIKKDKYIILEIIPTSYKNNNGTIVQLCALKIDGLKLIDRFDYRLTDEALPIKKFKEWFNFDYSSEYVLKTISPEIVIILIILNNTYSLLLAEALKENKLCNNILVKPLSYILA